MCVRTHANTYIVTRNVKVYYNNTMQNNYTIKLLYIIIKLLVCTYRNNFLNYVISIHFCLLLLK